MATTDKTTLISSTDDSASTSSWSRPYPPTERGGLVREHDKPFFYYGHLGKSPFYSHITNSF